MPTQTRLQRRAPDHLLRAQRAVLLGLILLQASALALLVGMTLQPLPRLIPLLPPAEVSRGSRH